MSVKGRRKTQIRTTVDCGGGLKNPITINIERVGKQPGHPVYLRFSEKVAGKDRYLFSIDDTQLLRMATDIIRAFGLEVNAPRREDK